MNPNCTRRELIARITALLSVFGVEFKKSIAAPIRVKSESPPPTGTVYMRAQDVPNGTIFGEWLIIRDVFDGEMYLAEGSWELAPVRNARRNKFWGRTKAGHMEMLCLGAIFSPSKHGMIFPHPMRSEICDRTGHAMLVENQPEYNGESVPPEFTEQYLIAIKAWEPSTEVEPKSK